MTDLDRYYTPDEVADRLVGLACEESPQWCVDSACGAGSLLLAAQRTFGNVTCVGIDKDGAAVRYLRRRYPNWLLSVADALGPPRLLRAKGLPPDGEGLLVLNPPFSLKKHKSIAIEYAGGPVRCSIAMAHMLRSIEIFAPKHGAVAIVPESLLFSETDAVARTLLGTSYDLRSVLGLKSCTFSGARANAVMVQLIRAKHSPPATRTTQPTIWAPPPKGVGKIELIRGGVPLFEARQSRKGVPLVHSTDIAALKLAEGLCKLKRVKAIGRGVVSGAVILIPRVGLPRMENIYALNLRSEIQLSDCVIALKFRYHAEAQACVSVLKRRWAEFQGAYHGTGARYVTVARLRSTLEDITQLHVAVTAIASRLASQVVTSA